MGRPTKFRRVEFFPECAYFVPYNKSKNILEVTLKVEELEAMRLKDIEELNQDECAKRMKVSRQTFQNIIDSARNKVAIALTKGNAIRIIGGHYTTKHCRYNCMDCNSDYEINYEQDKLICPICGSQNVMCSKKTDFCRKWCQKNNKTDLNKS